MTRDLPTFRDAGHAHTIYGLGNLNQGTAVAGTMQLGGINQLTNWQGAGDSAEWTHDLRQQAQLMPVKNRRMKVEPKEPIAMADKSQSVRRFVQVFIADTDDNVPLDQSMLYTGAPKLTDATDQELFFEIDIKELLATHNAARVKLVDKKVKERTEYLEPARIRDLQMVVVNIASFG